MDEVFFENEEATDDREEFDSRWERPWMVFIVSALEAFERDMSD